MQVERLNQRHSQGVTAVPQDSFLCETRLRVDMGVRRKMQEGAKHDADDGGVNKRWTKDAKGKWRAAVITEDVVKVVDDRKSGRFASPVLSNYHVESTVATVESDIDPAETTSEQNSHSRDAEEPCIVTSKKYVAWEFGKRHKTFTRPKNSRKTNGAATQIQRMMRGWWLRLKFRIALLQHKLDTREERTASALEDVEFNLQQKKSKFLKKLQKDAKSQAEEATLEQALVEEARVVIEYLRRDNKKLRTLNEKLYNDVTDLRLENKRIAQANEVAASHYKKLEEHVQYLTETQKKLLAVIPQYKKSIARLEHESNVRQEYCLAEHHVKVDYMKIIGEIVQAVEKRSKSSKLLDEVVTYCLNTEVGVDKNDSDSD